MLNTSRILVLFLSAVAISSCGKATDTPPVVGEPGLVVPDRAGQFVQATQVYGPLYVTETPADAPYGIDVTADTKPWSSYWYPITDDVLVAGSHKNGGQSTLEKYDLYTKKVTGTASTSVANESAIGSYVQSDTPGWQGRCNAWAMASVMEAEPILPAVGVTVQGITFYTRDVKALLLKTYELVKDKDSGILRFGERYDTPENDKDDIYPDQFHRVLQAELFDKHRPIIMDSDRLEPVWNKPIWWASTKIEHDPSNAHAMHVTTWVKATMSETIPIDYIGTWDKVFEYHYDLFGYPQPDGSFQVKYGKWTGKSQFDHPDFLTALPAKGVKIKHTSQNEQVKQSVVEDILARTGAFSHN